MASSKEENERQGSEGSEHARTQIRDSIEVIEYLLIRERVVWT